MKIQEIIDKLIAFHPEVGNPHTCDTVKVGDSNQECTGIVVTCFASIEVIRAAINRNANFIICHEPVFYNHEDDTQWLEGDPVYEVKRQLLEEHGIVIWRDHDHIHGNVRAGSTDGIFYGIMHELGWREYVVGGTQKPLMYEIPETDVKSLAAELMEKLNLTGIRVVGDQNALVKRVFFCEHVQASRGWKNDGTVPDNEAMKRIRNEGADVMIPFEIVDWTMSAYVRDSCFAGRPKAILEMGHFNVEELGMKCVAKWLPQVIGTELPVSYVQSGDSFSYITR